MGRPKKSQDVEGQLALIETEHPMYKAFKSLRRKYETLYAEKADLLDKIKDTREKTIVLIKENGIKPDADGVITFQMDGELVKIQPGESKLTFRTVEVKSEADDAGDDDPAEGD